MYLDGCGEGICWDILVKVKINSNKSGKKGSEVILAVGEIEGIFGPKGLLARLPKVLYCEVKGGKGGKVKSLTLSAILTLLSSFSLYFSLASGDAVEAVSVHKAELQQSLLALSVSPITSYKFLVASLTREAEEHTRPDVVGWLHRRLKTLIVPITNEPSNAKYGCSDCETIRSEGALEALVVALGVAGLLTTPTRHGLELRQAIAQTLTVLAPMLKDKGQVAKCAIHFMSALIADTYTWYAYHTKALADTYPAELRRLAISLNPIEYGEGHKLYQQLYEKLCQVMATDSVPLHKKVEDAVKSVNEVVDSFTPVKSSIKSDVLLGRLGRVLARLKQLDIKAKRAATIATGQWNIAYPLLFTDLLLGRPFGEQLDLYVLYTQNTLEQRLLEEYVRSILTKTVDEVGKRLPRIRYVLTSATDAMLAEEAIRYVMEALDAGKPAEAFVLAQGPATLALKLYLEALRKGIKAVMF